LKISDDAALVSRPDPGEQLKALLGSRPLTLLGVGPMSYACVEASIELASDYDVPIMLIASRRQIECAELGGGYVEGWTTEAFAKFVRERDRAGKILLCRDHGGPWQGTDETEPPISPEEAMARAKISYAADIAAGFSVIHVDPSIDPFHSPVRTDLVLERLFELYSFCWETACRVGAAITFEVGTEEQAPMAGRLNDTEVILDEIERFSRAERMPRPLFVVVQTGTKVEETSNVGVFGSPFRIQGELPAEIHVPLAIGLLRERGFHLKQHNTDYLDDEALQWLPRLGVSAANVAPEFGVVETRAWLSLLRKNGLDGLADDFLELAYASGKWKKWMRPRGSATNTDRAIIAGHYVFGTPAFREIKAKAERDLEAKGISAQQVILAAVKASILRYLVNFRLAQA
jgi:hypothetical protein